MVELDEVIHEPDSLITDAGQRGGLNEQGDVRPFTTDEAFHASQMSSLKMTHAQHLLAATTAILLAWT